jgi:predicted transcriptional regulator
MVTNIKTKNNEEIRDYLDGTIVYDFEDAKKIISDLKPKKYTVSDCVLLTLFAQPDKPIVGRVVMMKEVFLIIKEVLKDDEVQDPKFIPYRLGMYSFTVGNALTNLEYSGFLERKGKKNTKLEQFILTEKGRKHISRIWNSLSADTQRLAEERRKGWDQLGYDGILRLVYRKYPEYKDKSCIKDRYKTITWGKGVG